MGTDVLKGLEYLSLVSKVCAELEANIGCSDKILAEFIIDLAQQSDKEETFAQTLKENGAELPEYFVKSLLASIHAVLPPKSKADKEKHKPSKHSDSAFPGLSVPDDRVRVSELQKELEQEAFLRDADHGDDRHDSRNGDARHDSRNDRGRHHGDGRHDSRAHDRDENGDRSRRDRHDSRSHEKYDDRKYERGRDIDRDDYRRDRSERRSRREYDDHGDRHDRYAERDGDVHDREWRRNRDDRNPSSSKGHHSQELELYSVYRGRVSRVMDHGCFVQLSGFRDRKEGMVHMSQIATRMIANAKDVVKRDQDVWVKVISMTGNKISLSMRDVDQKTGEDLLRIQKSILDEESNPSSMQNVQLVNATDETMRAFQAN